LRQIVKLRAHLGNQLAVVAHLERRELLGIARDQVAEPAQQHAALGWLELWPIT
jgi:hypothetical protein